MTQTEYRHSTRVLRAVETAFGMPLPFILGSSRAQKICDARFAASLLMSESGIKTQEIRQVLGRERTSIHWHIKRIKDLMEVDMSLLGKVSESRCLATAEETENK